MKELIIIGAGSVGGFIATSFSEFNSEFTVTGFLDDDETKTGQLFCGKPVIGNIDAVFDYNNLAVVLGIAYPQIKQNIIKRLSEHNSLDFPSLLHRTAWLSQDVKIGRGVIVYPNCSVNYGSEIGDFVVMNMNCAIGHHTKIGDYCSLAPGVNTGGHTIFKEASEIGIGVSTKQNVIVGEGAVIGGQAMLTRDVQAGETVVGVPARKIDR